MPKRKNKRKKPTKNKGSPKLLIKTTLGNTIVSEGSQTLVRIVDGVYTSKFALDLHEGEMVVYHKQGIDKTLEEVEPHLVKSPRYASAKAALHVERDGVEITKFRHDLIRGVAAAAEVLTDNLEQRLFREEDRDFTTEEYQKMSDYVRDFLAQHTDIHHRYADSTVQAWLRGTTLAPENWQVFEALAEHNQEFAIYSLPKSKGGIKDHHRLYCTVRQGIMSYLASKGKSKKTEKKKQQKEGSISLTQEIDLVVTEFMEEIDDVYATARVVGVERINQTGNGQSSNSGPLRKGVLIGKPKEFEDSCVSPKELMDHYNILQFGLSSLLDVYMRRNPDSAYSRYIVTAGSKLNDLRNGDPLLRASTIMNCMGRRENKYSKWLRHDRLEETWGVSPDEITNPIYEEFVDGTVDRMLGITGSFQILQTYKRVAQGIPPVVDKHEYQRRIEEEGERADREIEKLLKKLRKLKIGGEDQPVFLSYILKKTQFGIGDTPLLELINDAEKMREAAKTAQLLGRPLYTMQQVTSTLGKYGAMQLFNFFPETEFIHEHMQAAGSERRY